MWLQMLIIKLFKGTRKNPHRWEANQLLPVRLQMLNIKLIKEAWKVPHYLYQGNMHLQEFFSLWNQDWASIKRLEYTEKLRRWLALLVKQCWLLWSARFCLKYNPPSQIKIYNRHFDTQKIARSHWSPLTGWYYELHVKISRRYDESRSCLNLIF